MIDDLIIYTPMYVTLFWVLVLLLSKRSNNNAKLFLGVFMIMAFIIYLSHAVFFKKHNDIFIYFDPIYNFSSLAVYPLYYWYIKLLTSETRINYKNLQLLIPAFVSGFALLIVYLLMSPQERVSYVDGFLFNKPISNIESALIQIQKGIYLLSRLIFIIQIIVFLILGIRLVKKYNWRISNFYSNLENRTIIWVKMLFISFIVASVMGIGFNIVGRTVFFDSTFLLLFPSVIFSGLLFIIGLQGHLQNYTVVDLLNDENQQPDLGCKNVNQEILKDKLLKLFEEDAIYRDSNLKMTELSVLLQTNRTYISALINTEFSCSFNEFVNRYRILESKKLLTDIEYKRFTLEHIYEKSGFGSIQTFIRVFKKLEKVTPGAYRNQKIIEF